MHMVPSSEGVLDGVGERMAQVQGACQGAGWDVCIMKRPWGFGADTLGYPYSGLKKPFPFRLGYTASTFEGCRSRGIEPRTYFFSTGGVGRS